MHAQTAQRVLQNALELQSEAARQLTAALQDSLPADQDSLPADLLTHTLSFLEAQPLGRIESVCCRWRLAARDALQVMAQRLGETMPILGPGESPSLALRAIELLHSLPQMTIYASWTPGDYAHTYMVSFEGHVWSWADCQPQQDGDDDNDLLVTRLHHLLGHHLLGHGMLDRHENDLGIPRLVDALTGLAVQELVLCSSFGAILTVEGQVWMWAQHCGFGASVPQLLPLPIRVASIVPGYALSEHGVLFSFSQAPGPSFLQTDAHSVLGEPIVQVSSCPWMFAQGEEFSPLLLTASGTAVYADLGPASRLCRRERVVSLSFVHAAGPVQEVLRSDHSRRVDANGYRSTCAVKWAVLDYILCGGCLFSIDLDFVLKRIPLAETVTHICDARSWCFALCANNVIYRIEIEAKVAKLTKKDIKKALAKSGVAHDQNPAEICDGALRWSLRNPAPSVVSSRAPRPPEHVVAEPDVEQVFDLPDEVVELSESACGECLARTAEGVIYYCQLEAFTITVNNNNGGPVEVTEAVRAVDLIRLECSRERVMTFTQADSDDSDNGD